MARAPFHEKVSFDLTNELQIVSTPQPVGEKQRIVSIDVLRGFAVLGILPVNIQTFSMISVARLNPTTYGSLTGASYWIWLLCHLLADEKFMTIFSMLFGAGILLMTSRIEAAGKCSVGPHYRRMGWLILLGLVHAYLLWSGDVLVAYGLCGLLVYFCRRLSPRTLLKLALLLIAIGSVSFLSYSPWGGHLYRIEAEIARQSTWMPHPTYPADEISAYRGNWITQMSVRVPNSIDAETFSFVLFIFWRATGLMLAGMALMKLGVFSVNRKVTRYWMMIGVAVCVGIPVTLYGVRSEIAANWDSLYSDSFGIQFNYWASLAVSLGWVGAMMFASRAAILYPFTSRLAAVGRMAFTNYIVQTLICTTIFYGHGLGLFGRVDRVGQFTIVVAIWMLQLVVSPVWLKCFFFGPVEWMWRSRTYLQWEPFL